MEILIGLAVATVLTLGWIYGNLFACVFLTLGTLAIAAFGCVLAFGGDRIAINELGTLMLLGSVAALFVIWLPRYRRQVSAWFGA